MQRHEIPTHLSVADKAFAGLTMRQLLTVAAGLTLAYSAATAPWAPVFRYGAAAVVVAGTALLALWRPAGRPLEEWAFVLLRYWAVPRITVWIPRDRASEAEQSTRTRYEVLLPEPAWASEAMRRP
jgi:hypothetical protein